jgi:hypothetical protein
MKCLNGIYLLEIIFTKTGKVSFSASGFLARFARCEEPLGAKIYAKKAERSVFDLALSEPRRAAPQMLVLSHTLYRTISGCKISRSPRLGFCLTSCGEQGGH